MGPCELWGPTELSSGAYPVSSYINDLQHDGVIYKSVL